MPVRRKRIKSAASVKSTVSVKSVTSSKSSPTHRPVFSPRSVTSQQYEDSVGAGSTAQGWMGSKERLVRDKAPDPDTRVPVQPALDVRLLSPGLYIWRLEKRGLNLLEDNDFGFFHEGSCYLILKRFPTQEVSLHVWVGASAAESDENTVHQRACELDHGLGRILFFSLEYQRHESIEFLRNFPDGIIHIEGKPHTSIDRAASYRKRLYVISGRKYVRATCTLPTVTSLKSSRAAILDGYPRMYVWVAATCCFDLRVKAITVARKMRTCQRNGRGHIIVIDERDVAMHTTFLKKLVDDEAEDGKSELSDADHASISSHQASPLPHPPSLPPSTPSQASLYRVGGDQVQYDMPFVCSTPIPVRYLNNKDSFLLEQAGDRPMYVWVGAQASLSRWQHAVARGRAFAKHKKYGRERSVCRIRAGLEPLTFRQAFLDWQERSLGARSVTRCFSISNVARVLFSRSDRRTVGPLVEVQQEDDVTEVDGTTESYVLQGGELTSLPWSHQGIFTNSCCYVVLHSALSESESQMTQIIYYWLGSKASPEDRKKTADLALDMDAAFGHTAVIARTLDGKEPSHFLSILEDAMIVYDRELQQTMQATGVHVYRVEQFGKESMRVTQVPVSSASLKSNTAMVVLTSSEVFLWFGRVSGSAEREYAKNMLSFLDPSRMYNYEVVLEDREPQNFWQTLGGKGRSVPPQHPQVLERRAARLVYCDVTGSQPSFTDIADHAQQDLSEDSVMLLDTFDEVYIWSGHEVGEDTRRQLIHQVFPAYMDVASAGRKPDDVHLRMTSQNSEPKSFTRHFLEWSESGYGGADLYDLTRKQIRQENTRIDVEVQLVDRAKLRVTKYAYKDLLRKELPSDVLLDHKEYHLSDRHFSEALKMERFHFYRMPDWKQSQILNSARLAPIKPPVFPLPEPPAETC